MPARGVHHICLTVNDLGISEPFYDRLTEALGFAKQAVPEQRMVFYSSADTIVVIAGARPENKGAVFDRFRVGLHHLAFRVESRAEVEAVHRILARAGATILDAPAEYPQYMPGYYATYFADPDGIKLEVVHTPTPVPPEPPPPPAEPTPDKKQARLAKQAPKAKEAKKAKPAPKKAAKKPAKKPPKKKAPKKAPKKAAKKKAPKKPPKKKAPKKAAKKAAKKKVAKKRGK